MSAHDDADGYAESELRYNAFMRPAYRAALADLALPPGSAGLDAGCGPGGLLPLLDDATGRTGRITALDALDAHLEAAGVVAARAALADRVDLIRHDLRSPLPFTDGAFDWAWCADVLWPSLFVEPVAVLAELRRVVRPGGTVAVFFDAIDRGMTLPGHPLLEQRLNRAAIIGFAGSDAAAPDRHPERMLGWLRTAGLVDLRQSAHLAHYRQPLAAAAVGFVRDYWFADRRTLAAELRQAAEIDEAAWATWMRLSDPGSPSYLLADPDYACFQTGLLAWGRVPEPGTGQ